MFLNIEQKVDIFGQILVGILTVGIVAFENSLVDMLDAVCECRLQLVTHLV